MNIVLCDRCGQEIPDALRRQEPVYPVYHVWKTDRSAAPAGREMPENVVLCPAEHVTLCPVCREQLKAFLCCADRAPVTATLARKRAIRRARLRAAMEGAYDERHT